MGLAVIFVMTLASVICWMIQEYCSIRSVWAICNHSLYSHHRRARAVCRDGHSENRSGAVQGPGRLSAAHHHQRAVLGVSILNITEGYTFLGALFNGFLSGTGFTFVLVAMAGVRERLETGRSAHSHEGHAHRLHHGRQHGPGIPGLRGLQDLTGAMK
jgi:electron transport complex protein RnfA